MIAMSSPAMPVAASLTRPNAVAAPPSLPPAELAEVATEASCVARPRIEFATSMPNLMAWTAMKIFSAFVTRSRLSASHSSTSTSAEKASPRASANRSPSSPSKKSWMALNACFIFAWFDEFNRSRSQSLYALRARLMFACKRSVAWSMTGAY